jgi:hypothetical protein
MRGIAWPSLTIRAAIIRMAQSKWLYITINRAVSGGLTLAKSRFLQAPVAGCIHVKNCKRSIWRTRSWSGMRWPAKTTAYRMIFATSREVLISATRRRTTAPRTIHGEVSSAYPFKEAKFSSSRAMISRRGKFKSARRSFQARAQFHRLIPGALCFHQSGMLHAAAAHPLTRRRKIPPAFTQADAAHIGDCRGPL